MKFSLEIGAPPKGSASAEDIVRKAVRHITATLTETINLVATQAPHSIAMGIYSSIGTTCCAQALRMAHDDDRAKLLDMMLSGIRAAQVSDDEPGGSA